jgi:hypothetical protein
MRPAHLFFPEKWIARAELSRESVWDAPSDIHRTKNAVCIAKISVLPQIGSTVVVTVVQFFRGEPAYRILPG